MGRRFLFVVNIISVIVALALIGLGYVAPTNQGFLIGGTLLLPVVLMFNSIFLIYWVVKLDKRVLLSIIFFACFFSTITKLLNINSNTKNNDTEYTESRFKIASFNILYYRHQNFDKASTNNYLSLFKNNNVAVFGLQEANSLKKSAYYSHSNYSPKNNSQTWIFSKYPVINTKVLDISFGTHKNRKNFTYADIVLENDTVRVFNLHFESYRFAKEADKLQKQGVFKFRSTVDRVFKIHEKEVNELINYIKKSPYPAIVMGDFNNNAYSYEYNQLIKKCNLKDTFVEAGNGFGATYNFSYFPTRIDFILVPKTAKVYSHKVIPKKEWSDHFPIIAEISL